VLQWSEVMFLGCFSVKISENSRTSKTEELHKELLQLNALRNSRYDEKWWVYKMQISQNQKQLQSLFVISDYAHCVIDEYMNEEVDCMV